MWEDSPERLALGLVFLVLWAVIAWMVASKAGYRGALGLLALIPCVNFIVLLIFAFTKWPIEEELERLRWFADTQDARNIRLPEEPFYKSLAQATAPIFVAFAQHIAEDMQRQGCKIEWQEHSYAVTLPLPGQPALTLFQVEDNGVVSVSPRWFVHQLEILKTPNRIGADFVRGVTKLLSVTAELGTGAGQTVFVELADLKPWYSQFMALVRETIRRLRAASQEAE